MKKIIRHISIAIKFSVVFIILFSIVANGAFAGQRVEIAEKNSVESIQEAQLVQGPPSPDELPQNMETSGIPDSEQQAYIKAPQLVKTDNNQSRYKLNQEQSKQILKEFINSNSHRTVIATTSQVGSDLGRQFTLVGAKPSGTS